MTPSADYPSYDNRMPRGSVWDRLSGVLLGPLIEIVGDDVTYKPVGVPAFRTIKRCWVDVWSN